MPQILDGKQVVAAMNERLRGEVTALKERGVHPVLAIVRVGERGDDIAYERGAIKRCETIGVDVKQVILPADAGQDDLIKALRLINENTDIHGCLLFRPLPAHMDDNAVRNTLSPEKDIDGITDGSLAGVFAGTNTGFPPCTPKACMEILDHFGIELTGKRAAVIGRSLVVGKPVAMMLVKKNATVAICHTRTKDMAAICREAEVLIVAAGRAGIVGKEFFTAEQIVIDVGIHVDANGKVCGDVNWDEAQMVKAVTPVPGGVGTVTTSVLAGHVVEAAEKKVGR